ncbi:MAG TPA: YlbF family regulator [Gemmatimonadaceae bacterium]|nr:YlbF family regulator [Gemmatimonadaceae bacterium]
MLDQKAKELGRLLGQSPEYQALRRARDLLAGDADLMRALQRLDALRDAAGALVDSGGSLPPEMDKEVELLVAQVDKSPVYRGYLAAHAGFEKLLGNVNRLIQEGIEAGASSSIITLS